MRPSGRVGRSPLANAVARLLGSGGGVRRGLVLVIACVACAALVTDLPRLGRTGWAAGDVAEHDVVSPITFSFVDEAATAERQSAAEADVPPVFRVDAAAVRRVESRISQAFDMGRRRYATVLAEAGRGTPDPEDVARLRIDVLHALELSLDPDDVEALVAAGFSRETEELALELVGVAFRRPIVEDRSVLPSPPRPVTVVTVVGDARDETTLEEFSLVRTTDEARQAVSLYVLERFSGSKAPERVRAAAALARAAIQPTFAPDADATEAREALAREAVEVVEHEVRKGTRIVRAGDVVTAQQVEVLGLLEAREGGSGLLGFVGWLGFSAMLLGTAVVFAQGTIRKFAPRDPDREALAFALVLVLLVGRLFGASAEALSLPSAWDVSAAGLLVPVAGGAMLVRVLVNSESALVWSVVAAVFASAMTERTIQLATYFLVTALVATRGVGHGRERWMVLKAGLQSGLVGAAFVGVLALGPGNSLSGAPLEGAVLLGAAVAALLGGVLSAVLTLGIVPAFEVFGFVTDYKLLELASLNHPLLRQLMLRAPGTYHHSVIVGSLSEAACEAIGANALLARVACYFHDIGKGLKPQYFVENQLGTPSRHDRLSPAQSAQLIINHVREGAVLARQYKLPRPIYDNIFMHHGTGLIAYFHARAKESAGPGEEVDEALFRYPGPKPDTREAGIIMLADKVEAACRTIKEPSDDRIRAMIQQIINGVMNDGQLENCPLTLKELYQIADTFTTVLLGIYHHRIEYPQTRAISSGKGRFVPVPKQGTITLEIANPLRPPPLGADEPVAVPDES